MLFLFRIGRSHSNASMKAADLTEQVVTSCQNTPKNILPRQAMVIIVDIITGDGYYHYYYYRRWSS